MRLDVVRQAMCPRLHVDRVGIRLLCTYRCPGTEWVESAAVDRRFPFRAQPESWAHMSYSYTSGSRSGSANSTRA
ncbi:MAG: DUF1826 domain-containing protein [Candidatus Accumulibacter sp. UW27]